MQILEELFSGNINPVDRYVRRGGEYQKVNSKLIEKISTLQKTVGKEESELLDSIIDDFNKLGFITDRESFVEGFCLGLKIMAEAVYHKSENFQ